MQQYLSLKRSQQTPSTTGGPTFSLSNVTVDGLSRLIEADETLVDPNGSPVTHALDYSYDLRSQLTSASMTNIGGTTWSGSYTYDKAGNVTSQTIGQTQTGFAYDGDLMTDKGNDSLDWDLNGRLESGISTSMEWNWDSRLRSATAGSTTLDVVYDPMGNRVERSCTVDPNSSETALLSGGHMKRKAILQYVCSLSIVTCVYAQPGGLDFYEDLTSLPYLYSGVESYYLSSYDRTGGNDDGFRGTYSQLYVDDNGEHVIFDSKGPGCVYNFWFTGSGRDLHWGKIKFYLDGEKTPRFECQARELFSGQREPFVQPLVTDAFISSGGFSCSAAIPFAKQLRITTEKLVGFYNIYYQLYTNLSVTSWTPQQDYGRLINLFQKCGSDPKPPSEQLKVVRTRVSLEAVRSRNRPQQELLSMAEGGVVQYLKINPLYAPDTYNLNHIFLQIFYDGGDTPAVSVPIGPFFGSGLGEADVRGIFVGMSTSGPYYCYLPMPFRKGIRMVLQNQSHQSGGAFSVQIGYSTGFPKEQPGASVGYFGAIYRNNWPIVGDEDYVLLDFKGRGAVIGQVMTVEPVKSDRKRWWEGDMRIYIDGEKAPRFHGTGHEDEYQGGWSTFWLTNPYSLPLFGEPKTEGLIDVYGQVNGSTTAYRFWPGKIHFQRSIVISTEHGNNNDTPANYSSLVYYYYLPE